MPPLSRGSSTPGASSASSPGGAVPDEPLRRRTADVVGARALERLMGVEAAVARARQRRVRAAPAVAEDRGAAAARLLGLIALVLLLGGELGLGLDVDPPAGEAGGEARVLALAADRQRELVVGDDHGRLA